MKNQITLIAFALITLLSIFGFWSANVFVNGLEVPGLVLGLRHNVNQGWSAADQPNTKALFRLLEGGDRGAASGQGFKWYMILDIPDSNPSSWKLPSGVVFGLMHSQNQFQAGITVFGRSAYGGKGALAILKPSYDRNSPSHFAQFVKQVGGDLGAPSGHGFYWYESTGSQYNTWEIINKLPRYTVVGLKHSKNQPNKKLYWPSEDPLIAKYGYDPANEHVPAPPGFFRMVGGDLGAPRGHGYFWYEKITDPH